jgi:hypothetical protein
MFPEIYLAILTLEDRSSWYLEVTHKGTDPWIIAVYWQNSDFHNIRHRNNTLLENNYSVFLQMAEF